MLLGRRGRTVWWALLPSVALFLPFAFSVLDRPRALLADPGLPLGFDAAPLWQQALGQPLSFDAGGGLTGLGAFAGSPRARPDYRAAVGTAAGPAVGLPVLLLALAALFMPRGLSWRTHRTARCLWAAAVLMLAGGWLAGHVASGASADILVTPFTGPAVSAAALRAPRRGPHRRPKDCWTPPTGPPATGWARKVLIRGTAAAP